jgi:hypothetical protein
VREFTKSVISYGWASAVFQLQQLSHVMTTNAATGNSAATDSYNALALATASQLGPTMQATFMAGDAMQRSMVNMMFGMTGNLDEMCLRGRASKSVQAGADVPPGGTPRTDGRIAPRPSWREPRPPEPGARRSDVPAYAAAVAAPPSAASSDQSRAAQGWGPMP